MMEHTTEEEKLFLVSFVYFLIPLLKLLSWSCLSFFLQSLLKCLDAKNNFLRKFVPLVKPAHEFAREKEVAMSRAKAEARAKVQAKLNSLREENRALRDRNLELIGSIRGESAVPTTF